MSISAATFFVCYFGALIFAFFRRPIYGLYAYLFAFYGYPPDRWWGADLPDLRWSLIAAVVTVLATARLPRPQDTDRWYANCPAYALILFAAWLLLQSTWALVPGEHRYFVATYVKFIILFYMMHRVITDEEQVRQFTLAHVIGCAYYGWIAFLTADHGRFENIGGPNMDGASSFASQLSTAVLFGGILLLQMRGYIRAVVLFALPLILNALILTQTRGAFVGLLAGGVMATYLCPAKFKKSFYIAGAMGVILFLVLANDLFWNRMETISEAIDGGQMDGSARSRLMLFDAQWEMFTDNPLLGTGHRGTAALSPLYLDDRWLSYEGGRSSHNVIMSLLVEQGIVGTVIFLFMMIWAFRRLQRLKKLDKAGLPVSLGLYRAAIGGALASLFVAGQFADLLRLEVTVWCLVLLVVVSRLSFDQIKSEVRQADSIPEATAHRA